MVGATEKRELKPTEPFWKTSEALRLSDPPLPPQETESDPRPRSNQTEARTLIVGAGMSLSGTITSCDRLVAEGTVDAKLDGCQQVIVAQTGIFRGNVSTDNADVHGRFEGELVVQKRLLVRAAGRDLLFEAGAGRQEPADRQPAGDRIASVDRYRRSRSGARRSEQHVAR